MTYSYNFILEEKPDCVINIIDVTNLERNLYLTTQLMELNAPIILALNMSDSLRNSGGAIDVEKLEKAVGLPVVEISALHETGIQTLMERAIVAAKNGRKADSVLKGSKVYAAIENAEIAFKLKGVDAPLFHAVKLVEGDELETEMHPAEAVAAKEFLSKNVGFNDDVMAEIADARYKYISKRFSPALTRARKRSEGEMTKSDKIDQILTHKWVGIPIFLVILFAVFHITFSENFLYLANIIPAFGRWCDKVAQTDNAWLSILVSDGLNSPGAMLYYSMHAVTATIGDGIAAVMEHANASAWAVGLVCDGVWGGVSSVLSFVPQILVLFLCFSILEDSGYMARVAFILDKALRRFGVSGRALMPMIMGFGCSIPAMVNTRTLADEKERTATIRVIPFFSCGAKAPILTAIAGAIITISTNLKNEDLIVFSMYLLGMATAVISLLIMRSTTMRGETPPFVMELPDYHMPRFKNLMLHLWDKLKHYIEKAFTIILVSCIGIWFLSNFSWNWECLIKEYVVCADGSYYLYDVSSALPVGAEIVFANMQANKSILGSIGMLIQPLFTPLGFGAQLGEWGWVFAVAAITGLIAKENVVATFGSLAACVAGTFIATETGADEVMAMVSATNITVPALISFIMFNMTTIPCFAAVASAKAEIGKGKFRWTLLFWVFASYITGIIVFTIGSWWWTAMIWAAVFAVFIVGVNLYNRYESKRK